MVFILVKRFAKVQNYGRGVKDGSHSHSTHGQEDSVGIFSWYY